MNQVNMEQKQKYEAPLLQVIELRSKEVMADSCSDFEWGDDGASFTGSCKPNS